MSLTYPKSARIRSKKQWQSFFKGAKSHQIHSMGFYFSQTDAKPRLGIVVRKSVMSKAVDRNRFKRLQREYFRHHQPLLHCYDVVVVAKPFSQSASGSILSMQTVSDNWDAFVELIRAYNTRMQ